MMHRSQGQRDGLTLIEVLIAMAMLVMALSALAHLQSNGARAALRTQIESQAMVLCQSELDAWLANPTASAANSETLLPIEHMPGWSKRVQVTEHADELLEVVTVEVYRDVGLPIQLRSSELHRPDARLVRWHRKADKRKTAVQSRVPGGRS